MMCGQEPVLNGIQIMQLKEGMERNRETRTSERSANRWVGDFQTDEKQESER